MIKNHTELLNALIEKYELKSYLEIGINNPANNFNKIKCQLKHGVDPACEWTNDIQNCTSDEFFERYFSKVNNRTIFDIIFIDGLHHADQVKRDFENSLRCLSDNGFIVIHDVLPENEAGTIVPRQTKQWWGDVYKWAMNVNQYRVNFTTYNIDNGCMVITKSNQPAAMLPYETDWNNYIYFRKYAMNVTDEVII